VLVRLQLDRAAHAVDRARVIAGALLVERLQELLERVVLFNAREPLPVDHPLRSLENVTLAPHLGYVNTDVFGHFYGESVKNIEAWLDGKPINVLNPDALK